MKNTFRLLCFEYVGPRVNLIELGLNLCLQDFLDLNLLEVNILELELCIKRTFNLATVQGLSCFCDLAIVDVLRKQVG